MARLVMILLSLFIWREDAAGASYYISPTGSDTTPGTCTLANPCASFSRCNRVMVAGDTCYARGGEYTIPPDHSGTGTVSGWYLFGGGAGPKTFRGYPGETAVFKPVSYIGCSCGDTNLSGYGLCSDTPCDNPLQQQDATITLGDARQDDYTFSDFTLYGRFNVVDTEQSVGGVIDWTANNLTLTRIIFKCPGAFGSGNTTNLMTSNRNDTVNNTSTPRTGFVVRNNLFLFDATCPDYSAMDAVVHRNLDGPDTMHLYANSGAIIENNDSQITSTSQLQYLLDQGRPPFRFHFWAKGRAEYMRARYNYCSGAATACVTFNSGACPSVYEDICYEAGTLNGKACTSDAECGSGICADCGMPASGTFRESRGDNQAYNNISNKGGLIGWDAAMFGQYDKVYNNTIYRPAATDPLYCPNPNECGDGIQWWSPTVSRGYQDTETFNNIVYSPTSDSLGSYRGFVRWGGGTGDSSNTASVNNNTKGHICKQAYFDNNLYWDINDTDPASFVANELFDAVDGDGDGIFMEQKNFGSFVAWKSYLASTCSTNPNVRETNSREADPLFTNAAAGDFRLQAGSPARTGGRGAGYPSYLGAIDPVNGTTIGCTFDSSCYGYTAPANNPRSKVR